MVKKRGQVWVETVVYTLIGLTIMALILGVAIPRINQASDRAVLTQTMTSIVALNDVMLDVMTGVAGNAREVEVMVKKGDYFINCPNKSIYYVMKGTGYKFSQPGESFKQGDITKLTEEVGKDKYDVYLKLDYSSYNINITYQDSILNKNFPKATAPYKLLIQNKGSTDGGNYSQINIESI